MFGEAFLVAPVTEKQDVRTKQIYFPDEIFYDYFTGTKVTARGQIVHIDIDRDTIPMQVYLWSFLFRYMKAGSAVAIMQVLPQIKNTADLRKYSKIGKHYLFLQL